jgi:hypothetical protein
MAGRGRGKVRHDVSISLLRRFDVRHLASQVATAEAACATPGLYL